MSINSILLIASLLIGTLLLVGLYLKARSEKSDYKLEESITMDGVVDRVKRKINDFINESSVYGGSDEALSQAIRRKANIENALNECVFGLESAKGLVKDLIKKFLYDILPDEDSVLKVVNFRGTVIEPRIKFEILMYFYKKEYGTGALTEMIKEFELDKERFVIEDRTKASYAIEIDDIDIIYDKKDYKLSYNDMIDIMTVLVYQRYKGFGILDTLNEMDINGFNCGTSGAIMDHLRTAETKTEWKAPRSVWLYFEGKYIHLRFLSFGTEEELLRVISLMVRYNRPGPLTEKRGYIVNTMINKSRILAIRPPMSEYPAVFVRKFTLSNATTESLVFRPKKPAILTEEQWDELQNNEHVLAAEFEVMRKMNLKPSPELFRVLMRGVQIPGFVKGGDLLVNFLRYLMEGQVTTAFTGRQGSGKTTMMGTMPRWMDPRHNIRVLEMAFELYLRESFPERNILTIQETEWVSATKGQDALKKSDAAISLAGEVATDEVAVRMIQFALIASLYTIFSHHANTTDSLVSGMRNHIVAAGGFDNTYVAERQVLEVLKIDVHLDYEPSGYRYVERITEVIKIDENQDYPEVDPKNVAYSQAKIQREYYYRQTDRKSFYTQDILRYNIETHTYETVNLPSEELLQHMLGRMTQGQQNEFAEYLMTNWK